AVIVERDSLSDDTAKIIVEGRRRARVIRFAFDQQFYKAEVKEVADTELLSIRALGVGLSVSDQAKRERASSLGVLRAWSLFRQVDALPTRNRRSCRPSVRDCAPSYDRPGGAASITRMRQPG